MCIFSGPVYEVSNTKIYCRIKEDEQTLVYSMKAGFFDPVAMILPIPVSSRMENAVKFIDLKAQSDFFKVLDTPFKEVTRGISSRSLGGAVGTLEVHEVGNYIASFVPHRLHFSRLDEAFRLEETVWDNLPHYKGSGFVVFQLIKNSSDVNDYHPMGFTFPTKDKDKLFFPTVHVHNGKVPEKEVFDHALYFQTDREVKGCIKSDAVANHYSRISSFIENDKSGLVDGNAFLYKKGLRGLMENKDIHI